MAAVMIGVDPHKASHTAVVISAAVGAAGRGAGAACAAQAERLLAWAAPWPERAWAIEGADGVGHLLAQQLLAAGERVADVPAQAQRPGAAAGSWRDTARTTPMTPGRWPPVALRSRPPRRRQLR